MSEHQWWDEFAWGVRTVDDEHDYASAEPDDCEPLCDLGDSEPFGVSPGRLARYGLTVEAFEEMLAEQDGRCAICKTPDSETARGLVVDHCHETGKVRGLLCNACNSGLGFFRDNVDALTDAVAYLLESRHDAA